MQMGAVSVARMSGVSVGYVRVLGREGKLPVIKEEKGNHGKVRWYAPCAVVIVKAEKLCWQVGKGLVRRGGKVARAWCEERDVQCAMGREYCGRCTR